jgi:predicted permease
MSNLLVALKAIGPLIFYMLLGYGLRRKEKFSDEAVSVMNSVVFKLLLPATTFTAIYLSDIKSTLNLPFICYAVGLILFIYVLTYFFVCSFTKENRKRGSMIQAIYRSNFVLIGAAIIENMYGPESLALPLLLAVFVSVTFNTLAIFTFEKFRGNKANINPLGILITFVTNPMIFGSLMGLLFHFLPPLPAPALATIKRLSMMTTPFAMIAVGASFKFETAVSDYREITACVIGRLIAVPLIAMVISIAVGYRGVELATILGMTMTPCAAASYSMAEQMGGDGPLAGAAQVFTALFSSITMFLWVYLLQSFGVL